MASRYLLAGLFLVIGVGCRSNAVVIGDVELRFEPSTGVIQIESPSDELAEVKIALGVGEATVTELFGAYKVDAAETVWTGAKGFGRLEHDETGASVALLKANGESFGTLIVTETSTGSVGLSWSGEGFNRARFSAACDADDHFMGLGSHAMDVDHVGQAFPLWVSEPGVGKSETDEPPGDWFVTGTRHASSYPVPFLLRPHRAQGLLAGTSARVEVDLCASDPGRFFVDVWEGAGSLSLLFADTPLAVVQDLTAETGRVDLPPAWAFAPWNDAIRGEDRVREVAETIRASGAASSVIWTEDWKGGTESELGYHLKAEWFVDTDLYPDVDTLVTDLNDMGFQWFGYFAPFLLEGTQTWDEAVEAGVTLKDAKGSPYTFQSHLGTGTSMVDLSTSVGLDWVAGHLLEAHDLGFRGWMADFAEWLPLDVSLDSGEDPALVHNLYPAAWQRVNKETLEGLDTVFFSRSGWNDTSGLAPVIWLGDQRTSFDTDDGFPTVVPLALGASASGVPIVTHDVAGYQTVGNEPSSKELWYRWALLGAYSPVLRTHHGAYDQDNWQFDTDEETLAHWVDVTHEHMRLFPYRYGLAAEAAAVGAPMIRPVSFHYGEDWGRMDAWLLGSALLVAPVLEEGASGREVSLPEAVQWYDWGTLSPVESGWFDADVDAIPVFAASGTTVPTFDVIPETLMDVEASSGLVSWDDADASRTVYLFGGGGPFEEADGTLYTPTGSPTGAGETTVTLESGSVDVAGVTLEISGSVERTYTVVVTD